MFALPSPWPRAAKASPIRRSRQVLQVPGFVWNAFTQTAGVVVNVPQKMVGVVQAAFGSGERDPNGPISEVGVGRVGGEIASADLGADGTMAKIMTLLSLIAALQALPEGAGHVTAVQRQ